MSHLAQLTRRVTRSVTTLLLIGVTLASAAYIAPGLFGYERYVITGGSMSGTFEKGSLAFEKQVPVADLTVGDVITYLPPPDSGVSTLVTHRITAIEPGKTGAMVYTTKGDANQHPDPWEFSLTSTTQPVVAQTVPHLGHVFIALANPQVRMVVIGGPAALIALLALKDLLIAVRPQKAARTENQRSHTPPPTRERTQGRSHPAELHPA